MRANAYRQKGEIIKNESSSNPGTFYDTIIWTDGSLSCNCKGWIYSGKNRGCRHTKSLQAKLAQPAVIFSTPNMVALTPKENETPAVETLVAQLASSVAALEQKTGRKFRIEIAQ